MTKSELIAQIAQNCGVMTKGQVEFIVNNVFSTIGMALSREEKVEIRGFGSFRVRNKKSKTGRNPKTGEKVEIDSCKVPYFRPGQEIKEQLLLKK